MQFSLKPYSFEVDEEAYTLPVFDFDLYEKAIADIYGADEDKQALAMRDLIVNTAVDKRTKDIIRKFPVKAVALLFRDWAGMGESEGESAATTS